MWSLIAVGFVFQVAGNEVYTALYGASTAPFPSVADALWLACYVPMTAALALRIRAAGGARGVVLLDILIAIGALSSISAAFVVDAILAGDSSSLIALVTALAYPVADLVLATLVLHLAAASGWRLGRATALMAVCFLCWAVTDSIYAYQTLARDLCRRRPARPRLGRPVRAVRRRGVDAPGPADPAPEPGPARAGRCRRASRSSPS